MKNAKALVEWYAEMGVEEATSDTPQNYFALSAPKSAPAPTPLPPARPSPMPSRNAASPISSQTSAPMSSAAVQKAIDEARALADKADTLDALEEAIQSFNGCALKKTAKKTVIKDGIRTAPVMIIGEAPGQQEDEQGIPFCGPSGKLLDEMAKWIHLTRDKNIYISNTVFWRPPANRQPTPEEIEICRPLVEKHIALKKPKLIVLAGSVAVNAILQSPVSIGKLRGSFHQYTNKYLAQPIPVGVTYHPSYLLRQPTQKRLAWQDWLGIEDYVHNQLKLTIS
jgi:uracil-DNA glycosylase family 4